MAVDSFWGNVFKKKVSREEELLSILAGVPVFEGLSRRELKKVERIVHRRRYASGEEIFRENQSGVGMYIIKKGSVDILQALQGGGSRKLTHLEEGDFTGEMALLDESPRSASAVACEDSEMIGFFRPDLFGLMDRDPRLGLKIVLRLAQMMAERLRRMNQRLKEIEGRVSEGALMGASGEVHTDSEGSERCS